MGGSSSQKGIEECEGFCKGQVTVSFFKSNLFRIESPTLLPSPYRAEVGEETERGGAIDVEGEQVLEVQWGLQRPGGQGQGGQQGAGGAGGWAC